MKWMKLYWVTCIAYRLHVASTWRKSFIHSQDNCFLIFGQFAEYIRAVITRIYFEIPTYARRRILKGVGLLTLEFLVGSEGHVTHPVPLVEGRAVLPLPPSPPLFLIARVFLPGTFRRSVGGQGNLLIMAPKINWVPCYVIGKLIAEFLSFLSPLSWLSCLCACLLKHLLFYSSLGYQLFKGLIK